MPQLAGLPDKTTAQHGSVIHIGTGRDDKIIAYYPVPDMYRRGYIAVDAAVRQAASAANVAIIANPDVFNRARIENHDVVADAAHGRSMFVGIIIRYRLHPVYQLRTMPV
jgi:hypothetical protein